MNGINEVIHVRLLRYIRSTRRRIGVPTVITALLLLASELANAQQYRIDVLVDARLRGPAHAFLEDLSASLATEAREVVRLEPRFVSGNELNAEMQGNRWAELAILPSTAFIGPTQSSALAAFEMPFVLPDMSSVIDLQRSPVGLAGLSRMNEQGMAGLVYLNAGTTMIASSINLDEPDDLQGRRVAISPQLDLRSLELLGGTPVAMNAADRVHALSAGFVSATIVNSGDTESWSLPAGGYLVTNSIQAQVGMVLAINRNWYAIPFPYRAMIGDAAIVASTRRDAALVDSEQRLREQAGAMGVSLVTFQARHVSSAIASWIGQQSQDRRGVYVQTLEKLKSLGVPRPRAPASRQRRGEAGRIFFATTRDDTDVVKLEHRFGDSRTDQIKCGEIGYQANRRELAGADIAGPVTVGNAACGKYLQDVLRRSQRVLIFVHGFNNRFSDAAKRAMLLKSILGTQGEVVLWSWPSRRDAWIGSYAYDKESAHGISLQRFTELLMALSRETENHTPFSLDILAHSMGSQHATNAITRMSSNGRSSHLHNLVLAAPDMPTDEFDFALGEIQRNAARITLYACGWDLALLASEKLNLYSRVGMGGQEIFVHPKLESINVGAELFSANHSYVFDSGPVLQDMIRLLIEDVGAKDRGLQRRPKIPWHYWELPQH